jgi:pimeloyl-ACP methyl ester carboxylesterase
MAAADVRDVLPSIAVPTLCFGANSTRAPPLRVAREFARAIPHTELVVIPGAGHMSNLERPEEFNAAIRGFCGRLP